MKFIELTSIDVQVERAVREQNENASITYARLPVPAPENRFGQLDYDDLERPVAVTVPVYTTHINAAKIAEYHARKKGVGTRIVFENRTATVVTETVDEVTAKLNSVYN